MDFSFSLCEMYYEMSMEHYEAYKQNYKVFGDIANFGSFNVLSHSAVENYEYNRLNRNMLKSAISVIIFQALAIETYINFYGVKKLGYEKFYKYDTTKPKPNLKEKVKYITKEATKTAFPVGEHLFQLIIALFDKRDKLVHFKGNIINLGECDYEEYFNYWYQTSGFVYDGIDMQVTLYKRIKDKLALLEGKQTNLLDEQTEEGITEICKLIVDMQKS